MTHASRCLVSIHGDVDTIIAPAYGAQKLVAAGVLVSSGKAFRRNFAVCVTLLAKRSEGQPDSAGVGEVTLVESTATDAARDLTFSVGQRPMSRIIAAEDGLDILVTSTGGALVWIEEPATLDEKGE